jgi:NADH dehydrogenase FAD-containing subunit
VIEQLGGEDQASEQNVARGQIIATDPWMRAVGGAGSVSVFGDCSVAASCQLPVTAQAATQQGEYLAKPVNKEHVFNPPLSEEGIAFPPTRNPNVPDNSLSTTVASFATLSIP